MNTLTLHRPLFAFISVLSICLAASFASAATLTWNTCDGSGALNLCTPQNPGGGTIPESARSIWTFDAIGPATDQVDVRAFRTGNALGGGTIAPTASTIWGGGMGAGSEGSSPQHAVDNIGYDELLVFQLPANGMTPNSFRIGWRQGDADISTWIGGTLGGPSDAFALLASGFSWDETGGDLTGVHGYVQQDFLDVPANVDRLFTNGASGAYLIIGARNEVESSGWGRYLEIKDGGEDAFKVMQVVVDTPSVPEPGTLLLLGSGLIGLGLRCRRARTA